MSMHTSLDMLEIRTCLRLTSKLQDLETGPSPHFFLYTTVRQKEMQLAKYLTTSLL